MEASWSPDGKTIAFVSNREAPLSNDGYSLYVMKAEGTGLRKLADAYGNPRFPSFSPDGRTILYLGDDELDSIGVDGTGQKRLAAAGNHWLAPPVWSPDGRRREQRASGRE